MPETRRTVRIATKVNPPRGGGGDAPAAEPIPTPGRVPTLGSLATEGGHASVRVERAENGAIVSVDSDRPGGPWETRRFVAGSPEQADEIVNRVLGVDRG